MTFFLMDNSRVCLPAEGNEPVERLKIIIQREQNPGEGGAWVEVQEGMLQYLGGETVFAPRQWEEVEMHL